MNVLKTIKNWLYEKLWGTTYTHRILKQYDDGINNTLANIAGWKHLLNIQRDMNKKEEIQKRISSLYEYVYLCINEKKTIYEKMRP
jgi:hypothetical protein